MLSFFMYVSYITAVLQVAITFLFQLDSDVLVPVSITMYILLTHFQAFKLAEQLQKSMCIYWC